MNEISKKNIAIVENLEFGIRKCFSVKNVSNGFTKNAFVIPMCLHSYSVIDFMNLYAHYVLEPLKKL
jgi:hypothetical protein